jgi:spore maturation protein SpmB
LVLAEVLVLLELLQHLMASQLMAVLDQLTSHQVAHRLETLEAAVVAEQQALTQTLLRLVAVQHGQVAVLHFTEITEAALLAATVAVQAAVAEEV